MFETYVETFRNLSESYNNIQHLRPKWLSLIDVAVTEGAVNGRDCYKHVFNKKNIYPKKSDLFNSHRRIMIMGFVEDK